MEFENPFRPGAGHRPPYLAGRESETEEFRRLLKQRTIFENLVLTGLRGVGKTVLLDTFKPIGIDAGWLWIGTDFSESSSISEESMALRLLTDLSVATSSVSIGETAFSEIGFGDREVRLEQPLDFGTLLQIFKATPGLVVDKLKHVLELAWSALEPHGKRGIIFAYDEAQNLSDHAAREEYPLSLLLDLFQSIQKKEIPFMLVLTGLPTLFSKLVDARTFAERMFRVVVLHRLNATESREAILRPIQKQGCPITFADSSVETITDLSGGYPYFIQFICREVYDLFIQQTSEAGARDVPVDAIVRKLDSDFFAGRWARATDRQRELLGVIAHLPTCDAEFTVQEVVVESKKHGSKPFSASHANQMLASLCEAGLVYKNRHGKYSFAVPLLGRFIERQAVSG